MLDGSKMICPPEAGLPLIVMVPVTLASSLDEVTEGVPSLHPQQATKTRAATRPTILCFALDMIVSLLLSVLNHRLDDGERLLWKKISVRWSRSTPRGSSRRTRPGCWRGSASR